MYILLIIYLHYCIAMQCDNGMVYMACGPACPQTCQNIGDEPEGFCDNVHCVEGCFCPDDFVQNGIQFSNF